MLKCVPVIAVAISVLIAVSAGFLLAAVLDEAEPNNSPRWPG